MRVLPPQDIECLASDGMLLVSCCLVGQIRVWDAQTGDCLTVIPKPRYAATESSRCGRGPGADSSVRNRPSPMAEGQD